MQTFALISAALVGTAVSLGAAARQAQDQPLFRSESDLVVLHVNVFDGKSDAVPDLPQDAFQIFEDGEPQTITFFGGTDVPVAAGLVLDNSSSMLSRQRMVTAGGTAFIRSRHAEDELFTIHFNEDLHFGLPAGIAFTSQESLLSAALGRYRPGGKTALFDAVIAALDHLERANHQKRVLVVLSDGEDNASHHSEGDMLERARNSDAIIYAVSNATGRDGLAGNPSTLRKLATSTGGIAYFPKSDGEVVESFAELGGNVRRGYSIGYVPRHLTHDGGFRHVKVTVRVPGRSNLRVRSRDGYRPPNHADER